jgi:hypothetical protein
MARGIAQVVQYLPNTFKKKKRQIKPKKMSVDKMKNKVGGS